MLKGTYITEEGISIEDAEIKITDFSCNGSIIYTKISVFSKEELKEVFEFSCLWHMEGQDFISQVEMALLNDHRCANCKIYGNS